MSAGQVVIKRHPNAAVILNSPRPVERVLSNDGMTGVSGSVLEFDHLVFGILLLRV